MKLCIKYRINPSEEQKKILSELSFFATKLYNTDNYMRRDVWDKTGKIPNWYEQKKILKENHWFKLQFRERVVICHSALIAIMRGKR